MRSRPLLQVRYSPADPRPGTRVRVHAILTGQSRTPIDRVCFHLVGQEVRQTRGGKNATWSTWHWVDLSHETEGLELQEGEVVRCAAEFHLPAKLPPAFSSSVSRISYVMEVRVDIPWWPDRTERYDVPILPARKKAVERAPLFDATPSDSGVQLELTVAGTGRHLGGELEGAVAIDNFGAKGVRRVELSVVAVDAPVELSDIGPEEIYRSRPLVLVDGLPEAGQPYPFRVTLPRRLPPTFTGHAVEVHWYVEARAAVRFAKDAVLRSEIDIAPEPDVAARVEEDPLPARIAPLGRERRARVWAAVAEKLRLTLDAERETMAARVGPIAVTVQLEQGERGLSPMAQLDWPPLGLGLELAERRWRDAFGGAMPLGDPAFDKRLAVRGRSASQVQAVLNQDVRDALLDFSRIALDDTGAELSSSETELSVETLGTFVRQVWKVAKALSASVAEVPAPEGLGPHRAAWAALAAKLKGTFAPGCFALRGEYRGAPVELITTFREDGTPDATHARALLGGPRKPTAEAKKVVATLAREVAGIRIVHNAVEAPMPSPLADPTRAEAVWRALARVVKALG